jgi:hypothetical protein
MIFGGGGMQMVISPGTCDCTLLRGDPKSKRRRKETGSEILSEPGQSRERISGWMPCDCSNPESSSSNMFGVCRRFCGPEDSSLVCISISVIYLRGLRKNRIVSVFQYVQKIVGLDFEDVKPIRRVITCLPTQSPIIYPTGKAQYFGGGATKTEASMIKMGDEVDEVG